MFMGRVQSKNDLNRNVKKVSYQKLLEDLRTTKIPGTLESIEKKIKSLRVTYRGKNWIKFKNRKNVLLVQTNCTSQSELQPKV